MKRVLYAAIAASAVLVSCQREEFEKPFYGYDELNAVIEEVDMTRTYKDESNKVLWSEDDRIVAFMKSTQGTQYKVKSGGKPTASFTKVPSDDLVSGSAIDHVVAYYPYSDMIECEKVSGGYSMNVVLPSEQVYVEKSFGNGSLPMASISSDNNITFRNVSGAMKLQLKGTVKVKSVKVEGKNSEKLSGASTVTVYADGSKPSVSMASDASVSVLLDCGDGVQLDQATATEFIIVIPPVVFTKGFVVTITDTSGSVYTIDTDKRNEIKRSSLLIMPEFVLDMSHREPMEGDYIDEYGINHGQGIEIDGTVWAPVNCGYHETDFKYGKLYQWGRKYGQGYKNKDASYPVTKMRTVSLDVGQSFENQCYLYYNLVTPEDWLAPQNNKLWNLGNASNPIKTEYDPCPDGWRVPTYSELNELCQNKSSWTTNNAGQNGYWLTGSSAYNASISKVFLSAAGYYDGRSGYAQERGTAGLYWDSNPSTLWSNQSDAVQFTDYSFSAACRSRAYALSVRCVKDDAELVEVSSVRLDAVSKTISVGESASLSATVTPSNANHKDAFWYSSNEAVATVDQTGKVTAVAAGSATITAMAGMQCATCDVTVEAPVYYIDEYGVNRGAGVKIGETIWAPVNCGYHATDYKYGKLYQWGRKYGQGYNSSDASTVISSSGPVSLDVGQSESNSKYFYKEGDSNCWLSARYHDKLWNSGSDDAPVKTEYDPCPSGWRVPTRAEMYELSQNRSSWTTENGQNGYWFSGTQTYSSSVPRIFLPAAGSRAGHTAYASDRGTEGSYWTSLHGSYPSEFEFTSSEVDLHLYYCAYGFSVRCVKDDSELIEVSSIDLNESSMTLLVNESFNLSTAITPSNANQQTAFWWSDDPSVATVDWKGCVTAVSAGTTTITAMAGMQCATCEVTVEVIPVGNVTLNQADLVLPTEFSYTLIAKVSPVDATYQTVIWTSDDETVVRVDEAGNISTISAGTANIRAEVDGVTAKCEIVVIEPAAALKDYVDEYGVNHGKGIALGEVVWAPVNCGYKATTSDSKGFPWGKLYQWGRKYGQGYSEEFDDRGATLTEGPISLINGQKESNSEVFYLASERPYDWTSPQNDKLWNSGTEEEPLKTEYDPCPSGWRVPTYAELDQLNDNFEWTTLDTQRGFYLSGEYTYLDEVPKIFLPAAGSRYGVNGNVYERGQYEGRYWSSRPYYVYYDRAYYLGFVNTSSVFIEGNSSRSAGFSVRCVQE